MTHKTLPKLSECYELKAWYREFTCAAGPPWREVGATQEAQVDDASREMQGAPSHHNATKAQKVCRLAYVCRAFALLTLQLQVASYLQNLPATHSFE